MTRKSFSLAPAGLGFLCWLIGGTIINAQEPLYIEINGDTLTADVVKAPLEQVIDELNQQTSASISISGTVLNRPDATVSATFEKLPLRDGINQLLKGHGHLLNFAKNAQPPGAIKIRLIAAAPPVERPVVSNDTAPPAGDEDLEKRMQKLLEDEDTDGLKAVLPEAVSHPDITVRLEALHVFDSLDEADLPIDLVQQMALTDPEAALRLQALEVIGKQNNERATEILKQLVDGADPQVGARARELLEQNK
jgi:hypothetical protein